MHGQCDVRPTLPFQSQDIAASRLAPNYTAWWQRYMCMNNLPEVVTWLWNGRELNSWVTSQCLNHYTTRPHDTCQCTEKISQTIEITRNWTHKTEVDNDDQLTVLALSSLTCSSSTVSRFFSTNPSIWYSTLSAKWMMTYDVCDSRGFSKCLDLPACMSHTLWHQLPSDALGIYQNNNKITIKQCVPENTNNLISLSIIHSEQSIAVFGTSIPISRIWPSPVCCILTENFLFIFF